MGQLAELGLPPGALQLVQFGRYAAEPAHEPTSPAGLRICSLFPGKEDTHDAVGVPPDLHCCGPADSFAPVPSTRTLYQVSVSKLRSSTCVSTKSQPGLCSITRTATGTASAEEADDTRTSNAERLRTAIIRSPFSEPRGLCPEPKGHAGQGQDYLDAVCVASSPRPRCETNTDQAPAYVGIG